MEINYFIGGDMDMASAKMPSELILEGFQCNLCDKEMKHKITFKDHNQIVIPRFCHECNNKNFIEADFWDEGDAIWEEL